MASSKAREKQFTPSPEPHRSSSTFKPEINQAVDSTIPFTEDPISLLGGQEAICTRRTFYVNTCWKEGINKNTSETNKEFTGHMYVESHEPYIKFQKYPIILIHGDHHTGQIWLSKPDGKPGWVSWFVTQGYHVYTCDLPPSGRSNFLRRADLRNRDVEARVDPPSPSDVEREFTSPGRRPSKDLAYPQAIHHSQWPGGGHRDSFIFENYYASLESVQLSRVERQALAQHALQSLLRVTGRAILIGEGTVAVIAVEPDGPPCGVAYTEENGKRIYNGTITPDASVRQFGLADIPLTYDPPTVIKDDNGNPETGEFSLDVDYRRPDGLSSNCMLQKHVEPQPVITLQQFLNQEPGPMRQLIHLMKIPHAVFTGHASFHSTFDFAIVDFMQQAGVWVNWFKLQELGIFGNGPLMFLEINSDLIAYHIHTWIQEKLQREFDDAGNWTGPRLDPVSFTQPTEEVKPDVDTSSIVLSADEMKEMDAVRQYREVLTDEEFSELLRTLEDLQSKPAENVEPEILTSPLSPVEDEEADEDDNVTITGRSLGSENMELSELTETESEADTACLAPQPFDKPLHSFSLRDPIHSEAITAAVQEKPLPSHLGLPARPLIPQYAPTTKDERERAKARNMSYPLPHGCCADLTLPPKPDWL